MFEGRTEKVQVDSGVVAKVVERLNNHGVLEEAFGKHAADELFAKRRELFVK